jgi:hypothetical protein
LDDREKPEIAARAQDLADSCEFEGFNALSAVLLREYDLMEVEHLRRDHEFRHAITERCKAAWERMKAST